MNGMLIPRRGGAAARNAQAPACSSSQTGVDDQERAPTSKGVVSAVRACGPPVSRALRPHYVALVLETAGPAGGRTVSMTVGLGGRPLAYPGNRVCWFPPVLLVCCCRALRRPGWWPGRDGSRPTPAGASRV